MNNATTTRRQALKLGFFGLLTGNLIGFGKWAYAQAAQLVDMTKTKRKDAVNEQAVGILSGMGYVDDADKAEKAGKLKRAERDLPGGGKLAAKSQYCTTCAFIQPADGVNSGKDGKCQIVPVDVLVAGHGYCNTFSPNAKADKNYKRKG